MSFRNANELKTSKRSDSADESDTETTDAPVITRILKQVKTTAKGRVIVHYTKRITWPLKDGEEQNRYDDIPVSGKLPFKMHKDFKAAMRKFNKHALALNGIDVTEENKKEWSVMGIKISGDLDMQNARLEMVLGKKVERTGKIANMPVSDITLYDNSENEDGGSKYEEIEALARITEAFAVEVFAYVDGKSDDEEIMTLTNNGQIPLF